MSGLLKRLYLFVIKMGAKGFSSILKLFLHCKLVFSPAFALLFFSARCFNPEIHLLSHRALPLSAFPIIINFKLTHLHLERHSLAPCSQHDAHHRPQRTQMTTLSLRFGVKIWTTWTCASSEKIQKRKFCCKRHEICSMSLFNTSILIKTYLVIINTWDSISRSFVWYLSLSI